VNVRISAASNYDYYYNCLQPVGCVQDYPGEPVPER